MNPQSVRLGYLMVTSPVANVYIGGIMVVDGRGLPVEFRYTEPIQPTRIQQILYGSVLNRYIKNGVILETLLKSLESKPDVVIVGDDSFLQEANAKELDMVRLTETKSAPLKEVGSVERISAVEYLLQLTAETSPIRVQLPSANPPSEDKPAGNSPKSLPDKSAEAENGLLQSPLYELLFEIGKITDLLEPLKRVEKALGALCQEAGIKSAGA